MLLSYLILLNIKAPLIAVGYYRLPENALWRDSLKCMMADESHHRDVNHTFADMKSDDPNPFLEMHKNDAIKAWRLDQSGQRAWEAYEGTEVNRKG